METHEWDSDKTTNRFPFSLTTLFNAADLFNEKEDKNKEKP